MFTGLIEAVGTISERAATPGGCRLRIASALASGLSEGDSLAVNGVCLTVAQRLDGEIEADLGPETLRVTTLGALTAGASVNLERPLRADGRIGGHFVLGHVDGVGLIDAWESGDDFYRLGVRFPPTLAPYIVLKGSIAVDGISLTVADLTGDRFDVQIVPYTTSHTNLANARVGARVNLECDIVGKYVVRAAEAGLKGGRTEVRVGEAGQ